MNVAPTIVAILLAISGSLAQAQKTSPAPTPPSPIYLRCNVVNEPEGSNDIHIDFAKKIVTDFFGTGHPFREEGPFIISETFTELNGKREVVTTTRINRYSRPVKVSRGTRPFPEVEYSYVVSGKSYTSTRMFCSANDVVKVNWSTVDRFFHDAENGAEVVAWFAPSSPELACISINADFDYSVVSGTSSQCWAK